MNTRLKILCAAIVFTLLILLPLAGVRLKGDPISRYTEFPPLTHYVEHAGFSWIGFAIFTLGALAFFGPLGIFLVRAWRNRPKQQAASRFPAWGWAGGSPCSRANRCCW